MTREELKAKLEELVPSPAFEEGSEWMTLVIGPTTWGGLAREVRSAAGLEFDYLFCVTAVDWRTLLRT